MLETSRMEGMFSLLSIMYYNQKFSTARSSRLSTGYSSIEGTVFICQNHSGLLENVPFESFTVHLVKRFTCTHLTLKIRSPKSRMPFVSAFILHKTFRRYRNLDDIILVMTEP